EQELGSERRRLSGEVEEAERQLRTEREERERVMQDAYGRLKEIESRAQVAEQRAADAERLAQLKYEEAERERRLREVLERVSAAEDRAKEAERRASAAESAAAGTVRTAADARTEIPERPPKKASDSDLFEAVPPPEAAREPEPLAPAEPEPKEGEEKGGGILGRTVGAILGVGAADEKGADENGEEEKAEVGKGDEPEESDLIELNRASFEQLRDLGFSVTQATRVITYRERQDGFSSLDDLDDVPGMPRPFLKDVKKTRGL